MRVKLKRLVQCKRAKGTTWWRNYTVAVILTEDSAEQVEPRATSVTTRDLIFIFKFLRNFTFQARRHQEESHFRHPGLNSRSDIQAVPKYSGLSVGHP